MIVPGTGSIQIVRSAVPDPEAVAAFVASPEFLRRADILKEDRTSAVFVADVPTELAAGAGLPAPGRIVVKTMVHDRPIKHFLQRWWNSTRLARQWDGSCSMQEAGVRAQRPFVLFRSRDDAGRRIESLVLEWLPGKTLLEHMAHHDLTLPQEHAVADALGEVLGGLMSKSVVPDDIKPSNIVVTQITTKPTFAFLDTPGVVHCDFVDDIEPEQRCLELVLEPLGVGCLPRRALLWRTLRSIARHYHPRGETSDGQPLEPLDVRTCWKLVEESVRDHGDPTPKIDPLKLSRRAH